MAVLPANGGLLCAGIVFMIFGLLNITMPVSFLKSYNLDLGNMNTNATDTQTKAVTSKAITTDEKIIISTTLQLVGVTMFASGGANTITYRGGTDDQKSTMCLMNGIGTMLTVIIGLCTVGYWTDVGVSATGLYINAAIFFVVAVVNFLGVIFPPTFKLAPFAKPLYWGFLATIPLYVLYMFMFFFGTEFFAKSYGLVLTGNPKAVLMGLIKFGLGPAILQNVLFMIAQIIAPGALATYSIVRMMCIVCFGNFMASAYAAAVWTCRNANGSYDDIIQGQGFNMFLWAVLFLLFYYPLVQLDNKIKEVLEKEIGSAPEKKTAKKGVEASAEPAPEAEILLPPVMPVATAQAFVPSYSMVQQPQVTYAAPATTAYATPYTYAGAPMATTAYAAPATTAYAAPVTYTSGGVV